MIDAQRAVRLAMSIAVAAAIAVPAAAQEAEPGESAAAVTAALARQEAEARAFDQLYERLAALQVSPDATVADVLKDADLRAFIWDGVCRRATVQRPQVFSDAVTVVQVSVPLAEVVAELKAVAEAYGNDMTFEPSDFDKVLLYTARSGLWGLGQSRGQMRSPLAGPAPVGWDDLGVFGRLDARRQATDNAHRQLVRQVRALRFTPSRRVGEFLDSDDRAAADLRAFIRSRAEIGEPRFLLQRICEIDLSIRMSDLVTELKALANAYHEKPEFAPAAFDAINALNDHPVLRATGVAVPQRRTTGQTAAEPHPVLTCTSDAGAPENVSDRDQAQLLAQRAAVAQCRETLRRQIMERPAPTGELTLGAWMAGQAEAPADVEALLTLLRVIDVKDRRDSRVQITAELPVGRLEELIAFYQAAAKKDEPPRKQ